MSETLKRAKMEFRIQNGSRCSLRLGKGMLGISFACNATALCCQFQSKMIRKGRVKYICTCYQEFRGGICQIREATCSIRYVGLLLLRRAET